MSAATSSNPGSASSTLPTTGPYSTTGDFESAAEDNHALQGAVIGLIVGAVIVFFMVTFTVVFICRKRRQHRRQDELERREFQQQIDAEIQREVHAQGQLPAYSPPNVVQHQPPMRYYQPPPPPARPVSAHMPSSYGQQENLNTYAFPAPQQMHRSQNSKEKMDVQVEAYELGKR